MSLMLNQIERIFGSVLLRELAQFIVESCCRSEVIALTCVCLQSCSHCDVCHEPHHMSCVPVFKSESWKVDTYLYYHRIRCLYLKGVACMDEPTGNYYQTSQLHYGGLERLLADFCACFSAKNLLKTPSCATFPAPNCRQTKLAATL